MTRREIPEDVLAPSKGLLRGAAGGFLIWLGLACIGWHYVGGSL